MTISNKSKILAAVFIIILGINAIILFNSTSKVKQINEETSLQTEINIDFMNLKYILRGLQEISTDIALMGEKEGLEEIKNVKKEYLDAVAEMKSMKLHSDDVVFLRQINDSFDKYFDSLYAMAEAGVKRKEARDLSKSIMKKFDSAVSGVEDSISKLDVLPDLVKINIKYQIVSTQEILTDALAMGDNEGIEESKKMQQELNKFLDKVALQYPAIKSNINNLKSKYNNLSQQGQKMAMQGVIFENMLEKVELQMQTVDSESSKLEDLINNISKTEAKELEVLMKDSNSTMSDLSNLSTMIIILFLIGIIFLIVILKNIVSNISKLDVGVKNLLDPTKGSTVDITSHDEIGTISNNFNKYLDSIESGLKQDKKVIDEARVVIGKVNVGLFNERIKLKPNSNEIGRLVDEINGMIDKSLTNLTALSDTLLALGNAKYDYKIPRIEGLTGLTAALLSGTKITQSTINDVIALIDNSNKRLSFSAEELRDSSVRLSDSSNQQAAALEQTAAAIEQVTSTITQSSESAAKMSQYAKNVTDSSKAGVELANKTSVSMDELSKEVNTINEAITVIDQIAFQTNILSLNAAVEAATAGEAGKGFAVVAQEVRNLASRSAEAANEIKALVESANSKAMDGKKVSAQMIDGFSELNENIETTISLIDDVAVAAKEQEGAMVQINDTVNSLDQATQKNAVLSDNISDMAKTTKDLTDQLQAVVDRTSFDDSAKKRVCDTNKIFDFAKLKCDHINFKNTNFSECESGKKIKVKTCHECNLGKWIDANEGEDFAQTQEWEDLKLIHARVHHVVQDVVDLYKDDYDNGQIISVTESLEVNINKIFKKLDCLRERNCDIQFDKKKGA
jgi:methyl-accepting chemotaxis protein